MHVATLMYVMGTRWCKPVVFLALAACAGAQAPGGGGPTHPRPIDAGPANPEVKTQGAAPDGPAVSTLTLDDAVKRALKNNLGAITADTSQRSAEAFRLQALSALLPTISANLSETETQVNLAAYGFKFNLPPGLKFSIPTIVGPFSYSQATANVSANIWDPVANRNLRSARESERSTRLAAQDVREMIVLATAQAYVSVLTAESRIQSQRAQVANAQAIYNQAVTRKEAGTNARIDVTRSQVELQTEQQRLAAAEADLRKQKIALARMTGLPLGSEYTLSTAFAVPGENAATPAPDAVIADALRSRRDLQAAEAQVHAAELAESAARAERLPSIGVNGDYGVLGPNPTTMHGVFAVTGSVNIPIWQGERVKADIESADSNLRQRRAELADARVHVEQDVRDALVELETAIGQVRVARSNRDLAADTLTQARDRFGAGVATTVEVVQAEQQVASAEDNYTSSLLSYQLAQLSLARASGKLETELPKFLEGSNK